MKFSLEAGTLAEAALWATRVTSTRPTNPALSGILLEAGADGVLSISGYDNEASGVIQVAAGVEQTGKALVHAATFSNVAKGMPKGKTVDVEVADKSVTLTSGRSKYRLQLMDVSTYPALPVPPAVSGTVDGDAFARAVQRVSFATAASNDGIVELSGMNVEISGELITLMATDRYRLALAEVPWKPVDPSQWEDVSILVKPAALDTIAKSAAGELTLHIGGGTIGFTNGARITTSTLMDGQKYPAIRRLLGVQDDMPTLTFNVQEMVDAVARASVVLTPNAGIILDLDPAEGIIISSGADDTGEEIVAAEYEGPGQRFKANATFLAEGLRASAAKDVVLHTAPPGKPLVLSLPDDPSHRQVLMPMAMKD